MRYAMHWGECTRAKTYSLIPEVVDGAFRNGDEARACAEIVVRKLAEAAESLGVMHDTRIKSEMIKGATCETILSTMFNRNCKEDEELIDDIGKALVGRNLLQEPKLHARLYIDHSVSSAARYSLVDNVMVTTIVLVREMFEDLHGLLRL
ncbi:MAG: hypothetical protein KVP17_002659 [Porospora cf. gigantea B]|uniref:uncharacterized protein n=1 Tax=Porospora cf. gigantea B TaxID=2853592 RepID=UPI003571ABE3|nr:MAG: hypothetical protein KVP17_002659 [Porospora cf. gigantea B]